MDPLLLDKLSNGKEVSAYGAGLRVLSALIFLPLVFTAVIGPLVTQASVTREFEKIRVTLHRSLRLLLSGALIGAIFLSLSSTVLMNILFGSEKYTDAAPLVIIFGWAFIPISLSAFITDIAVAEGKYWVPAVYTFFIMTCSIICNLILIPSYGAVGSAIAKCISVSLGSLILLMISGKLDVLNRKMLFQLLGKITGVALLAQSLNYVLSLTSLPSVLIFICVVIVSLVNIFVVFKIVSVAEFRTFLSSYLPSGKSSSA